MEENYSHIIILWHIRRIFEERIKNDEKLLFVNASNVAYIEGAIHMPFQEAVEKYVPDRIIDYERIIQMCPKSNSIKDGMKYEKCILNYIEKCKAIRADYKKCYQLYKKLKNTESMEDVNTTIQKINNLYIMII